jgi:hypothetical protein
MLAERGAAVLARCLKLDPRSLLKRSWYAAEHGLQLGHDLEVNAFFVELVVASQNLPDEGLYHWVGQDSLRRGYQEDGIDLAPDGWGRYLTPSREVLFHLEWDRGTESPKRLATKAAAYLNHYPARSAGPPQHVFFAGPGATREETIRAAIARAGATPAFGVRFWTTHSDLLHQRGSLGEIWQLMGSTQRRSLTAMEGRLRTARPVTDCIGKPSWWDRRPGAGEGA